MTKHEASDTVALIGRLWPNCIEGRWSWADEVIESLGDQLIGLPIDAAQAKAALMNLVSNIATKSPAFSAVLKALKGAVSATAAVRREPVKINDYNRQVRDFVAAHLDEAWPEEYAKRWRDEASMKFGFGIKSDQYLDRLLSLESDHDENGEAHRFIRWISWAVDTKMPERRAWMKSFGRRHGVMVRGI